MGSGPGNKPSHGGHSYKSGATVVTVLSLCPSVSVFLFPSERWDAESRAYARAEQEQSELEKQKDRSGRAGATGIREQKARGCAAVRAAEIENESEKEQGAEAASNG